MALAALKRKKLFEQQLQNLENAQFTLDAQIATIEGAATNMVAFEAMVTGRDQLQGLNKNMCGVRCALAARRRCNWLRRARRTAEKVDAMVEDIREQHEVANEITNAFSMATDLTGVTDEDVEGELNEMLAQDSEEEALRVRTAGPALELPSVPAGASYAHARLRMPAGRAADHRTLCAHPRCRGADRAAAQSGCGCDGGRRAHQATSRHGDLGGGMDIGPGLREGRCLSPPLRWT